MMHVINTNNITILFLFLLNSRNAVTVIFVRETKDKKGLQ